MSFFWYQVILRTNIDSRFGEIFMMIPEEAFAGPSVM